MKYDVLFSYATTTTAGKKPQFSVAGNTIIAIGSAMLCNCHGYILGNALENTNVKIHDSSPWRGGGREQTIQSGLSTSALFTPKSYHHGTV